MGPTDGTLGSSDTAKLQLTTSSKNTPCTQLSPMGPREAAGMAGRRNWAVPPLTTDPTAVAKGLQRALARWLWALPP